VEPAELKINNWVAVDGYTFRAQRFVWARKRDPYTDRSPSHSPFGRLPKPWWII